eukprot:CAMPEP_0194372400 /NCGR_PEP_ID=MMETSP0174-20130528/20752_1 /TAXON_ID=216777 /ORGANISM="Proboscia alata, Strain PI-D3" /LENGTH=392 /DNA_ID=CAMNT_0039150903 /DNA_START=30 /DNA_END=1205 /DNA_ORIENTATION=+
MEISAFVTVLFFVIALTFHLYGHVLRQRYIYTQANCCDMTWSLTEYNLLYSSDRKKYNLYHWKDARDPRSCPSGKLVMYIPGHWGSYTQARSLGAHGIGLTGRSKSSRDERSMIHRLQSQNGTSADVKDFFYNVYTVDFNDEGSALHAYRLYDQIEFVRESLVKIVKHASCGSGVNDEKRGVILVGHSMGGLVAKAMLTHTDAEYTIEGIITLATPHYSIPYPIDGTVLEFQKSKIHTFFSQQPSQGEKCAAIISIAGGWRDELIPPSVTQVNVRQDDAGNNLAQNSISLLASNISQLNEPSDQHIAGIDHRAIVWCHNLLASVKRIIHVVSTQSVKGNKDSSCAETIKLVKNSFQSDPSYSNVEGRDDYSFKKLYDNEEMMLKASLGFTQW